jgi:hypothetical protein
MQIDEARAKDESGQEEEEGRADVDLAQLAHAIAGARAQLGQHGAVFARGPLATQVAMLLRDIAAPPPPLEPAYSSPVAWILLDRSCDLAAALSPPASVLASSAEGQVPAANAEVGSRVQVHWPVDGGLGYAEWWQLATETDDDAARAALAKVLANDSHGLDDTLQMVSTTGSGAFLGAAPAMSCTGRSNEPN